MSRSLALTLAGAALVAAALGSACTTDFTGYHLDPNTNLGGGSSNMGAAGVSASAGSMSGSATTNGDAAGAGQASAGQPSDGGASDTTGEGGALSGGPLNGGPLSGSAGSDDGPASSSTPPSCEGLASTCGSDRSASCCAASLVPGGSYERSNQPGATATVSAFALDDYEVTVGRFRSFMQAYSQNMTLAGSGKNPSQLALDPGWNQAWNTKLPANAPALGTALQCANGTFTPSVGANESEPVTCVSWYEAYAFCIWDGGRLPTEAEWNYAAAAGSEERKYPWGASAPDDAHAVFCPGSCSKLQAVGSKAPTGDGKWGQADLVGNAWEWNLDVYANPYAQASCNDCANTAATSSSLRVFRGGSSGNDGSYLLSAGRYSRDPSDHNGFVGVRCARAP